MTTSKTLRDQSIRQVEENADQQWLDDAYRVVKRLAKKGSPFTTDEVWKSLKAAAREPRAMGAVMTRAYRDGVIQPTDSWKQSVRASSHARPLRVWQPVS